MDLDQIRQWVAGGELGAVEDAWLEAIERGADLGQMAEVLSALSQAGRGDLANTLGELLLTEVTDRRPPAEAYAAARTVLPALEGGGNLRALAADLCRRARGQVEHFEEILKASGLTGVQSFRRAFRTLETCLGLAPGAYLVERVGDRVLRVIAFKSELGCFELAGPTGPTTLLDPQALADDFDRVADTDFRVLARFRGEQLPAVLQDDPAAGLIGLCAAHGGRIDAAALKDLLVPRYLEPEKWSGWWNRARSAARKSGVLSLEGRNPVVIVHHPAGRSPEEELAEAARRARDPLDCLALLGEYARRLRERKGQPDPAFLAPVLGRLAEQIPTFRHRRFGDALLAALVLDAAAEEGLAGAAPPRPPTAELLAEADDPAAAVAAAAEPSLYPHALAALAAGDDAPRQFERLLRLMPAGWLDKVVARLPEDRRAAAVAAAAEEALARPAEGIQICLWLWRGPARPVETAPLRLLTCLLGGLDDIARDEGMDRDRRRAALHQARAALVADDCRPFHAAMKEMDSGVAATVRRRIERCAALTDTVREKLLAALRSRFRELFVEEKIAPWLDESVVWTTAEALHRQEEKLKDLTDVQLPAVARAIGEAAKQGDLSENSDWQFAVEEKRRLEARVAHLQNELIVARVLHREDVPTDSVGIGSRVVLARDDGPEVVLTFLGPWDGDLAEGIMNYKARVAQSLMGLTVGDTVTLRLAEAENSYTIRRIEPAV